ncbi:hypothetical protein C8J57DRAFT_1652590 [Mycena rebaudengoi]|nr:hypothetical protein C8J57DRAFT_1652590 [Mycena rebaudengoi]
MLQENESKCIQFHIDAAIPIADSPNVRFAYASVRIADLKDRVRTKRQMAPIWREDLAPLSLKDSSEISFRVKPRCRSLRSKSSPVTTDPYPLHKLLEMQNTAAAPIDDSISPTGSIELPLHSRGVHIGVLTVTIRELSVLESAKLSSEMAEGISHVFKKRMFSEKHAETYRIAYEGLARIAGILDVVNGIAAVTSLALVEPVSSVAAVLKGIAKVVQGQIVQDAAVMELVESLKHVYDLTFETDFLPKDGISSPALAALVDATSSCAKFLKDFCASNFLMRLCKTPLNEARLRALKEQLRTLEATFHKMLSLQVATDVHRLEEPVDNIRSNQVLEDFRCVSRCRPSLPVPESDGAHSPIVTSIMDWATSEVRDDVGANVFWLHGPAGCGKSHIIAQICAPLTSGEPNCLIGARFFFQTGVATAEELAPTLAYDLACFDARLKREIVEAVVRNRLVGARSLSVQLEKLVVRPLCEASDDPDTPKRPLLIIIDGMDQCGSPETQDMFLKVLLEASEGFPPSARLLLTSRDGVNFRWRLRDCSRVVEYGMNGDAVLHASDEEDTSCVSL